MDDDLVGPGQGGSPTGSEPTEPSDRADAAADPDVAAMIQELRSDDGEVGEGDANVDVVEAAEHAGTGTDR